MNGEKSPTTKEKFSHSQVPPYRPSAHNISESSIPQYSRNKQSVKTDLACKRLTHDASPQAQNLNLQGQHVGTPISNELHHHRNLNFPLVVTGPLDNFIPLLENSDNEFTWNDFIGLGTTENDVHHYNVNTLDTVESHVSETVQIDKQQIAPSGSSGSVSATIANPSNNEEGLHIIEAIDGICPAKEYHDNPKLGICDDQTCNCNLFAQLKVRPSKRITIKRYRCIQCNVGFTTKKNAKRHAKCSKKAFECFHCGSQFARVDYRNLHQNSCKG